MRRVGSESIGSLLSIVLGLVSPEIRADKVPAWSALSPHSIGSHSIDTEIVCQRYQQKLKSAGSVAAAVKSLNWLHSPAHR